MLDWEPWIRDAAIVVLSVGLSVIVSWLLGPVLHVREERARRDFASRREVSRALIDLINRLHGEQIDRRQQKFSVPIFSDEMLTQDEVEQLLWHILHALDSPDLKKKVVARVRGYLGKWVAGPWRMEYLATCPRPEDVAQNRRGFMAFVYGQTHPEEAASLITRMVNDTSDESIVAEAIVRCEEARRLLGA